MKYTFLFLLTGLLGWFHPCFAQQTFQDFREKAKDYSVIYNGKTSLAYSRQEYANHPFWETEEFRNGTLCYQGHIYTEVPMRYDMYRKTLTLLNNKRVIIDVDRRRAEYFILNGVRFIPDGEDYRMILHEGKELNLTAIAKCNHGNDIIEGTSSYRSFASKVTYILTTNGTPYEVKKLKSFIKLFPSYKKQLKKYANEQGLDFKAQSREAFTALSQYTESLIKAESHAL